MGVEVREDRFFLGKRCGTRGECYFRKMDGRRCWNGKLFFHRLREVNDIYIFRWGGFVLKEQIFNFFFGGFVLYISQRICFCGFFFFGYHETTGYSTLDFFLSSYLPIFSSTFKRHFLPPFFVLPSFSGILIFSPFPYSSSHRMFLIVFLSYFLVLLIHLFLFICLIFIIYFSFPIFFNLS